MHPQSEEREHKRERDDRAVWASACRHAPLASRPTDDWCVVVPSVIAKTGFAVIHRGRRMHPYRLFKKNILDKAHVYSVSSGQRVPLRTLFQHVNAKTLTSRDIHSRDRLMHGGREIGVIVTFDRKSCAIKEPDKMSHASPLHFQRGVRVG